MKPSAMPASVESSAARGVALRTRSATNAPPSSMMPEANVASSPACQATRAGSGSAGSFGERLRRQHDEEHVREERDGVDAVGQRADVRAARALREPLAPGSRRRRCRREWRSRPPAARARRRAPAESRARRGTACRSAGAERDCRARGRRSRRCRRERSTARGEHIPWCCFSSQRGRPRWPGPCRSIECGRRQPTGATAPPATAAIASTITTESSSYRSDDCLLQRVHHNDVQIQAPRPLHARRVRRSPDPWIAGAGADDSRRPDARRHSADRSR